MTCSNWLLTLAGVAIMLFALWPGFIGDSASKWVVVILAVIIVIVAWIGVDCKFCKKETTKKKKK